MMAPNSCRCDRGLDLQEQLRACKERHLLAQLRPRFWFSRMVVALQVLVLCAITWFEDASLTAQAIEATGRGGWALVLVGAGFCLVALLDVAINDLAPQRFALPTAWAWRHVGFGAIGLQQLALAVLVAFTQGYTALLLTYWLNAALAGALVFFDAFARYPRRTL